VGTLRAETDPVAQVILSGIASIQPTEHDFLRPGSRNLTCACAWTAAGMLEAQT